MAIGCLLNVLHLRRQESTAITLPQTSSVRRFGNFNLQPRLGEELIPRNFGRESRVLLHQHASQQDVELWHDQSCAANQQQFADPASRPTRAAAVAAQEQTSRAFRAAVVVRWWRPGGGGGGGGGGGNRGGGGGVHSRVREAPA